MEELTRYKLNVRLEIGRETYSGPIVNGKPSKEEGYWRADTFERLSVNEEMSLGSMDFMGVMHILGELHTTIQNIGKVKE